MLRAELLNTKSRKLVVSSVSVLALVGCGATENTKMSPVERFDHDYASDYGENGCLANSPYDPAPFHNKTPASVITLNGQEQTVVKPAGNTGPELTFDLPDPTDSRPLLPADEQTSRVLEAYDCVAEYQQ